MQRLLVLAAAVLLGCPPPQPAEPATVTERQAPQAPLPDGPRTVGEAARATRARLTREPLRWTARHSRQGDYQVFVENQWTPRGWRRQLRTIDNGREALVIDLIEHDRRWHVLAPSHLAGVYRPFEAPLEPASHYDLLHRSRLRFADEATAPWRQEEGSLLVSREEVPAETLRALAALDGSPAGALAVERHALLQAGVTRTADPETGLIIREQLAGLELVFSDFRWEEDPALAVPAPLTGAPEGAVAAQMMLARCFGTDYRLPCEADALLVAPEAPPIQRRVPATGMAVPAAIFPDRVRVLVLRRNAAGQQAVVVTLDAGNEQAVGGEALAFAFATDAALSPTGDRVVLAVQPLPDAGETRHVMVALSDPGVVTPLQLPPGARDVTWLRDERGLLFLHQGAVHRLHLATGAHARITAGDAAVPLDPERLLLRLRGSWHLLRLDGGKPLRFGRGLEGLPPPAVSPDAAAVYFVHKDAFRYLGRKVPTATPDGGETIPLPPGRFERPVWR